MFQFHAPRSRRRSPFIQLVCHSVIPLFALCILPAGNAVGQVTTSGYQNVPRAEAPGTLVSHPDDNDSRAIGRTTTVQYLRGWLIVGGEIPGSEGGSDLEMRVYDISDPTAPIRYTPADFGHTATNDSWFTGNFGYDAHGTVRVENYLGPTTVAVDDFGGTVRTTNAGNASSFWSSFGAAGKGGRSKASGAWGADFFWYGTASSTSKIWKRVPSGNGFTDVEVADFDHIGQFGGGNWHPIFFGDLLIYARSDASDQNGIVVYRLTYNNFNDPDSSNWSVTPQLVGVLDARFEGYWPNLFSDGTGLYLVGSSNSNVQVADLTDVANPAGSGAITKIRELTFDGLGNATYPRYQDQYAFIDHVKFDMTQLIAGDPNPEELVLDVEGENVDTSQMSLPLGNLWLTGGMNQGLPQGMAIWVQQQDPDATAPQVAYHVPQSGRTNYPADAPLSFMLHEAIRDTFVNVDDFTVRKVLPDDSLDIPVAGTLTHEFSGMLTFIPDGRLDEDATYQVDFLSDPANEKGFVDAAGNYIEPYTFRFSTGGGLNGNTPPSITEVDASDYRPEVNEAITVTVTADDADTEDQGNLEYRFNFDGIWSDWSSSNSANGQFSETGRFLVRAQVRDTAGNQSLGTVKIVVLQSLTGPFPTQSNALAVGDDGGQRRVWTVNPDSNTVSVLNAATGAKVAEYQVGVDPRSIARDANGRYWVTCHDSDEVWILNTNGQAESVLDVGYGSGPFGVAPSPDGQTMYVSLYHSGHVLRMPIADPLNYDSVVTFPTPRALAVSGDGRRIFVTRFISPFGEAEVQELESDGGTFDVRRTITLQQSTIDDGGDRGSGTPNYLAGIAISPDGAHAVVTSKQDNIQRGTLFDVDDLDQDNTVRAILSVIDLSTNKEIVEARRDLDNSEGPYGVSFSPDGALCFVTLQGNNTVVAIDALTIGEDVNTTVQVEAEAGTGLAPQGVLVDDISNRVFVQNFMSRSVSVLDASQLFGQNNALLPEIAETDTVANELLAAEVLLGKQIFYNAADSRMSGESYISCATCHIDGGHDGRVWDFTGRGEGLRRTTSLQGRGGMDHGNVHWSGNFDEIQDFEHDIRGPFGGEGFLDLTPAEFASQHPGPASNKAGLSSDLDALAAYVTSLKESSLPRSPYRNADGTMTMEAMTGKQVFDTMNCATCHSGNAFTDSPVSDVNTILLPDVGTISGYSGQRLGGGDLAGVDTPTLWGLHASRVFLHHGQAASLAEVFEFAGGEQLEVENGTLVYTADSSNVRLQTGDGVGGSGYKRGIFGGVFVQINDDSEDINNSGNLDVNEDLNENGQLDPGEDVDGDGKLDTVDEDLNSNGLIDVYDSGVQWTGVEGGGGGAARVGIRYVSSGIGTGVLRVNGASFSFDIEKQLAQIQGWHTTGWRWAYVEVPDSAVNSGASNTVEVLHGSRSIKVDAITFANDNVLAQAQAHRQVMDLNTSDRDALMAWLLQLDGRDPDGQLPAGGGAIVEIDPWSQYDGFVFRVENTGATAISRIDLAVVGGGQFDTFTNGNQFTVDPVFAGNNQAPKSATVTLNFSPSLAGSESDSSGYSGNYNAGDIDGNLSGIDVTVYFEGGGSASGSMTNVGDSDDGDADLWQVVLTENGGTTVLAEADDGIEVSEGNSVNIDVLANDTGNALSVDAVTQGNLGAVLNNGSDVTYTPGAGVWSGSDSFTYTATDGISDDEAVVNVTITSANGSDPIPTGGPGGLPVDLNLNSDGFNANRVNTANGTWQLASDAGGIDQPAAGNDQIQMLADDSVTGDFQAVVQLVGLDGPAGSRFGLMLRDGTGAGARFVSLGSDSGNGYNYQTRTNPDAAAESEVAAAQGSDHTFATGKWVAIQRVGDTVTLAVNDNDDGYTQETTVDVSGWTETLHVGLYVHSGNAGGVAVGEFDNFSVTALPSPGSIGEVPGSFTTGKTSASAPAGENRLLVFVAQGEGSGNLNSVTYGGQSMTKAIGYEETGGPANEVSIWYLADAGIAAASDTNFVTSWSGNEIGEGYSSFFLTGVDQANPLGAVAGTGDPYPTAEVELTTAALPVEAGDYAVVGAVRGGSGGTFTYSGGFSAALQYGISSGDASVATQAIAADGSVTPGVSHSTGNYRMAVAACVFQAAEPPPEVLEVAGTFTTGKTSASVPSGENRLLVFVAQSESSGDLQSVSYGGQSMTKAIAQDVTGGPNNEVSIWYLDDAGIAAASDTAFVTNWSGNENGEGYSSFFLTGVDQTNPLGETVGASDPYPTADVTVSTAALNVNVGDYAVLGVVRGSSDGTFAYSGGFTEALDYSIASGDASVGIQAISEPGSVTPAVSHSVANYRIALAGCIFRAGP